MAVATLVSLSPSETVKVAPSLIVPVSLRAVRSWLGITYIVNVFVSVSYTHLTLPTKRIV